MKNHTNPTQLRHRHRCCVGFIVTSFQHYTIRKLKGKEKTIQTIHKSPHKTCIFLTFRALRNVRFVLQTMHKLYTNPTLRVKESKRQRDKETKRQRVKETKRGRDKESKRRRKHLSLEGYTVNNPGQRPGIAGGKERLAWKAIRPRRWRRKPL